MEKLSGMSGHVQSFSNLQGNLINKMKLATENLIKIILAILLLVCLFHLPYGYYQFIRFIAVIGFSILAYYQYERKNIPLVIIFVALALLFQPLEKVPLGGQAWDIADLMVAVGLVVSIFIRKSKSDLFR